ncbi:UNVERIFIED_CONTAM: hypothetical protein Sindi_1562600 [Sesamum indicum]
MMLLDGCFIIELFLAYAIKSLRRRDDPCFSTNNRLFQLRCDLILFQNQIPFFILEQLFHLVPIPKHRHMSLIELALFFFKKLIDHSQFPPEIFRPFVGPNRATLSAHVSTSTVKWSADTHRSANTSSICRDWSRKGHFQNSIQHKLFPGKTEDPIPGTSWLYRNLIAMELSLPKYSKHVTSYTILTEQLLLTKEDVRLLGNRDILIDVHERREEEIVLLFKSLHVDMNVKEFWTRLFLVFLFTAAFILACSFLLHHFQ